MSKIALDRTRLLGFDDAKKLSAKVGGKTKVDLDRTRLLGFDDAKKLSAKVGKKPVSQNR